MDVKAIKELAQQYTTAELTKFADDLENTGTCAIPLKADAGELMSDILQAAEIRALMDKGATLPEALREFSKRVRTVLS
jgi:hypothetical protein